MLGPYVTSTTSSANNRIFVYEVTGLAENEVTATHQSPIRSSHSKLIQVPYYRMNEFMRQITMLGGKIVDIRPLEPSQ